MTRYFKMKSGAKVHIREGVGLDLFNQLMKEITGLDKLKNLRIFFGYDFTYNFIVGSSCEESRVEVEFNLYNIFDPKISVNGVEIDPFDLFDEKDKDNVAIAFVRMRSSLNKLTK